MSQESKIRMRGTTSASEDRRSRGMEWKVTWWMSQGVNGEIVGGCARGGKVVTEMLYCNSQKIVEVHVTYYNISIR